jgi:hypothetical protein
MAADNGNTRIKRRDFMSVGLNTVAGIGIGGIAGVLLTNFLRRDKPNRDNPFEYDIDSFKQIDPVLRTYSETGLIPLCFQDVYGIAVDGDDNIYVTGDNTVLIMKRDGELMTAVPTAETALSLDVDSNGDIYLAMTDHIEIFDRAGNRKSQWDTAGRDAMLTSIKVTDEFVFAADAGNRIVRKFDKRGNEVLKIAGKNESRDIPGCVVPSRFFDVTVDPDGFIWVVNPGRHSLENYTPEGDLRASWGEYSMKVDGFCGCCNPSHITIMDDGKFITSEKGIPRVKVYDRLGNLEAVVAGPDQFTEGTVGLDLTKDSEGRILVLDPKRMMVRIFEKNTPGGARS